MKKVIVLLAAIALLAGGFWFGKITYKGWSEARLLSQSRAFMAQADYRNASLCLQKLVKANPSNIDACRLMADLAEAASSENALFWRNRVLELQSQPLSNRLTLVQTALKFTNPAMACNALALAATDTNALRDPLFHKLAGTMAWASNNFAAAENHYLLAARLEPANPTSQLNLATIQLLSTNPATVRDARLTLNRLTTNQVVCGPALRHLTLDAMQRHDSTRALEYSQRLVQIPAPPFADRIFHLQILQETENPAFASALNALTREAATNAANVAALGQWMLVRNDSHQVASWITSLPKTIQTNDAVPWVFADACVAQKDWTDLLRFFQNQDFGEKNYLRWALCARAKRALKENDAASANWRKAIQATHQRVDRLALLAQTAAGWQWPDEAKQTLWLLIENHPEEKWAFQALQTMLYGQGDTPGLENLLRKTLDRDPNNNSAKNNLATIYLLRRLHLPQAHSLAGDAYHADPQNPFFITTQAYSLFLQNKKMESLALFEKMDGKQLTLPAIAAYYGAVLASSGQASSAASYLALAAKAPLLPEEKALVAQAQKQLIQ
jgi:Tfp pilus assembly protein PilF